MLDLIDTKFTYKYHTSITFDIFISFSVKYSKNCFGVSLLLFRATAQEFTIAKNTVSAVTASATSPMPPAFESVLPKKDFFDLLAYSLTPPKS